MPKEKGEAKIWFSARKLLRGPAAGKIRRIILAEFWFLFQSHL
jgi:hypothetical protein